MVFKYRRLHLSLCGEVIGQRNLFTLHLFSASVARLIINSFTRFRGEKKYLDTVGVDGGSSRGESVFLFVGTCSCWCIYDILILNLSVKSLVSLFTWPHRDVEIVQIQRFAGVVNVST